MQIATMIVIIFWDIFKFAQISLSPQVKWSLIKYGIYELPNEFKLRILGN